MRGIYKIISPTGKVYIGQTINLNERKKDYESYNCKAQRILYNSLKKYNFENHIFEIIIEGEFTPQELNELEIKYIKEFNSFRDWDKKGMNLTTGGDNFEKCEESKKMISESLTKFHANIGHSAETKLKIANSLKGKKQSQEIIDKRMESNSKYWDKVGRPYKDRMKKKKEISNKLKIEKEIRNQEIVSLLKEGVQQYKISEKYKLSPSAITELKKKHCPEIDNRLPVNGENNNFSKLTEKQVKEIKQLLQNKIKQQEIADKYNVKLRTIKAIKSGQNWATVTI